MNKNSNPSDYLDFEKALGGVESGQLGKQMMDLLERLFPICRSITGDGVRESIEILQEIAPLTVHEVPTGFKAFDWTVPKEWRVRDAYIKNSKGQRVVDFRTSNLHLLNYSIPISAEMSLDELRPHLYTLPDQPHAVPYLTSYYEERWGFCLSQNQLDNLPDDLYQVEVDTELKDGHLTYADIVSPGSSSQEILFSTYLCHPSMANDNLSGPVLLAFLHKVLSQFPHRYTYRFVFVPETIGCLVYLSQHGRHLKQYLEAGYVVTCVGGPGPFTYKRSRRGNTASDKVAEHCLRHLAQEQPSQVVDFFPSGSDERQYCSPGFDLPVGSLMHPMYGTYSGYHNSLDDLGAVSAESLAESIKAYIRLVQVHDLNRTYINQKPWGEPQLSKRGLYTTLGAVGPELVSDEQTKLMYLLAYSDGSNDIIDIADSAGQSAWVFATGIRALVNAGLLVAEK